MFADSVQKLLSLWQMCDELEVDTGPAVLGTHCTVVPLDGWYSYTFDHWDPRRARPSSTSSASAADALRLRVGVHDGPQRVASAARREGEPR